MRVMYITVSLIQLLAGDDAIVSVRANCYLPNLHFYVPTSKRPDRDRHPCPCPPVGTRLQ